MSGSNDKSRGRVAAFFRFISWSALAGVLGTAVLTPAIAISGIAITTGISVFENMPDYIKPVNAAEASTIYATKNGKPVVLANFYSENRISVPYDKISSYAINGAVVFAIGLLQLNTRPDAIREFGSES